MKKFFLPGLITIIIVFAIVFQKDLLAFGSSVIYYSPCDTPIPYAIGTIDEKFNVKSEELLADTKIASNVWSSTQNKPLFIYDPSSKFTINMEYDSRQALTTKISALNNDLKQKQENSP